MNKTALLAAISASFQKYKTFGARSPQKLVPLHTFVADSLAEIFGSTYEIAFYSNERTKTVEYVTAKRKELKTKQVFLREAKIKGKYYSKNVDITVFDADKKHILCIGIKFVTSNYKQNGNNYFENMLGESVNIQKERVPYFQFIVLRTPIPYYDENKVLKRWDNVSLADLEKYFELAADANAVHRPYSTAIILVSIDNDTAETTEIVLSSLLSEDKIDAYNKKLSIVHFMEEIKNLKIAREV